MQKRILALPLAAVLLLVACAKGPTWQEQYDLGMRYLSESNYQEAVIAFAAAIAIDEKRPEAFISRGDAYMGLAAAADDPTENLGLAAADYQAALALDETDPDVYERLADVYLQQGEVEKALDILQQGLDKTGDQSLQARLDALTGRTEYDPQTTPDGQGSEGVVPFTSRANYRAFEDFTPEEQQFIESVVTAVIAEDADAFRNVASTPVSFEIAAYTMWNDYKVRVDKHVYNAENDEVYEDGSATYDNNYVDIELRPENGTGYCYTYWYCPPMNEESVELATCPCADWQWNGLYEAIYNSRDGISYFEYATKGTMQEGICQGTFVIEGSQIWTDNPDNNYTFYDEYVYQDGVRISGIFYQNGELISEWDEEDRQAVSDLIWGIHGIIFDTEERYW